MHRYFAIAAILTVSIFTSQVQAGQKERALMAYTIIELSGIAKTMTELVKVMMVPYLDRLKRESKEPIAADVLSNIFNEELDASEDDIKWELAIIYTRNFTESELRGILQFYKSPPGQRLLAIQPILEAEGAKMGGKWMEAVMKRALERFQAAYGVNLR